jgi:hypothetical protein
MNDLVRLKRKPVKGELIEPEVDGFVMRPPLCVFCDAPWTSDMLKVMAEAELEDGYYGDTYLSGQGVAHVEIICGSCKRLIYRKDILCNMERKW